MIWKLMVVSNYDSFYANSSCAKLLVASFLVHSQLGNESLCKTDLMELLSESIVDVNLRMAWAPRKIPVTTSSTRSTIIATIVVSIIIVIITRALIEMMLCPTY